MGDGERWKEGIGEEEREEKEDEKEEGKENEENRFLFFYVLHLW